MDRREKPAEAPLSRIFPLAPLASFWQVDAVTLQELIRQTPVEGEPVETSVFCQILQCKESATKNGKPYRDLEIADGTGTEKFKVWQDAAVYDFCEKLKQGDFVSVEGYFRRNSFGLNIDKLRLRSLTPPEIESLLAGSPERQEFLQREFNFILETMAQISDPRIRLLTQAFLSQFGERFKRAAAARDFHHARRGGLLEHTAQMLRAGVALKTAYPDVNWDLVWAGILFHDCGKLWENDYAPDGFVSPFSTVGELLGHISIGIEVVNRLWRILEEHTDFNLTGNPSREMVREHLLHLIASHHGEKEYGAPVTPRTPEAWMLHYIDNMDARYEMLKQTYLEKSQVAPGIYDYRRPLEGRAVAPLAKWKA